MLDLGVRVMVYTPAKFKASRDAGLSLAAAYPLALLVSQGQESHFTHMPMYQSGDFFYGHFAAGNPHGAIAPEAFQHTAVFKGPDAYISPGWYEDAGQVPTWNYQVVHITGELEVLNERSEKLNIVNALSAIHEAEFEIPWTIDKLPASRRDMLLDHIVGCRLAVRVIETKFKLSQNKPAEVDRVAASLNTLGSGEPSPRSALGTAMLDPLP